MRQGLPLLNKTHDYCINVSGKPINNPKNVRFRSVVLSFLLFVADTLKNLPLTFASNNIIAVVPLRAFSKEFCLHFRFKQISQL